MAKRRQIVKVILLMVLVYLSWVLGRSLWDLYQAKDRLVEAEVNLEEVKAEQELLSARLEEVRSDEFKEKEVRDKLTRRLPGETVVLVPEVELVERGLREKNEEKRPNWQKWWDLFFGE
ncbi:FtsB family cell division protein [Candidatus Chazhemtobacterium aquaticus]|uniref:Septum formation initiator family protein n=1 Tax=Candidatus Chazhemtobacterium aquaticus TaxID=2715735 RepID=A0A857NBX4_9BACT|nr:septum formation initiator family protein [Candidatus Chazhemtobacterium aquaticus]QHO63061.1 hypothetical protein MICH65_0080 [Candidatus Chazhemtobacterium aquaticus]